MARFKCKNCGNVFLEFCNSEQDSFSVVCPDCSSHWTEFVSSDKELRITEKYISPISIPSSPTVSPKFIPKWTITCLNERY